ncbi:MAG: hypothetical protein CVU77_01425 [Elusimicrobia bacterium HGW-Elusimicrobia-1]|jgi:1,4-alpha-glucan branching enzyme|nr:MAG: hypothetical protein CVU77_01425 [Elusimicrobia bacterium HGW-Elusimicrobia-1]
MKRRFVVALVCALTAAFAVSSAGAKLRKVGSAESGKSVECATRVTGAGVEFVYENPSAKNVFVAGSFNDWNSSRDALSKDKKGVWRATLPLKTGTHQYKFVVDGNWMADPSNPQTSDDGLGGKNSAVEIKSAADGKPAPATAAPGAGGPKVTGEGVRFVYKNPAAKNVFAAGEFNAWNAQADPLIRQKDGTWLLVKKIPPGRYNYKFIVDGQWLNDPVNTATSDDGYGGKNSVLEVVAAAAPSHKLSAATRQTKTGIEFVYENASAKSVAVAGSFNNWSASSHRLEKDKSGIWKTSVPLGKGKYQYKFVVDGEWKEDPSNSQNSEDGLGGKNSVIEVR